MSQFLSLLVFIISIGVATNAQAQPDNAFFEASGGSSFSLAVCPTVNQHCPAVGTTVTIEAWGSGGRGGQSEIADDCINLSNPKEAEEVLGVESAMLLKKVKSMFKVIETAEAQVDSVCVHSGAGGGAGGYIKVTYTIPPGVTELIGTFSASSANYQGETLFGAKGSAGVSYLGRAYAGANGSDATNVSGGMGMTGVTPLSGKFALLGNGASLVSGSNGAPGRHGVTVRNCVGGPGGAGGAQNNGWGAGGKGADGSDCTTNDDPPTLPDAGESGKIKIGWYTPVTQDGGSVSFNSPGQWSVPVCASHSSTCPGRNKPIVIEIWGGGAGGEDGQKVEPSIPLPGGWGGDGGLSGAYQKVLYYAGNTVTSLTGLVGKGGASVQNPALPGYGDPTTFGITTSSGSKQVLATIQGAPLSGPVLATGVNGFSSISAVGPSHGGPGNDGSRCSGGGGGFGGILEVNGVSGPGNGGNGGHGGYRNKAPFFYCTKKSNNYGVSLGTKGKNGRVRVIW